jgi:hypothetical protein
MWVRSGFFCAACGVATLLSGCGGSSTPSAPAVSPLAGNWLIVGPMPTNTLQFPPVTGFRLAMTFDVTGNNIVGAGFVNAPCQLGSSPSGILSAVSVSFGTSATGTVAADDSFSVQTSSVPVGSISIQGKMPQASSGEWPGSYTASINPPIGPPCNGSSAGTVTATSFPLISGTYVGTGSSQTTVNGVSTPVTLEVTMQQGGTVVDQVTGKPFSSNLVLTGSIRVHGSPCFTSGVMSSSPMSGVEGNQVIATFTMDDGSTLRLQGAMIDPTEARITSIASVIAGQCGKVPFFFQVPELDRQN